jgi:SAM-dependent methyltransferase
LTWPSDAVDYVSVTRSSYERDVENYCARTASFDPFPGLAAELEAFAARTDGLTLDLGAGSGRDTHALKARSRQVVSADIAFGFLCRLAGPRTQLDMRALPFRSASFGAIWCCATLLHLTADDALVALGEMRRVLLPGGLLEASVKAASDTHAYGYRKAHTTDPRWFSYWTEGDLGELAMRAGLKVEALRARTTEQATWITLVASRPR